MNEKLLQYLWNYKLFTLHNLKDVKGNPIEILNFGAWNHHAGPDFLEGKIKIEQLQLFGNIELHLRSSDWIFHQHTQNTAYDNIILHVVYLHDVAIPELEEKGIPTLELKNYISPETIQKYQHLNSDAQFIPCERLLPHHAIPFQFAEEFLLKKLDEKSNFIQEILAQQKNDYEATLFQALAYAFGLKINAPIFQQLFAQLPFSVIRKVHHRLEQIEALFYGTAGWLTEAYDDAMQKWKREYEFLVNKYQLPAITIAPKFLRLRPPNFPTLRLAQFAQLLHQYPSLFTTLIETKKISDIKTLFSDIQASSYWDNHYNFGKPTKKTSPKKLTSDFIDLLLLNAILPVKYTYLKNLKEDAAESILEDYVQIGAEKNSVTHLFSSLGIPMNSAIDSQAFLYLHKNYCTQKKCLDCSIGYQILKI